MNIVIAAEIFPPDIGGPATYSKNLAQELIRLGWDVKLVCYSDQEKVEDDPKYIYRIKRSNIKILHYKKYYSTLKKLAKDCDVIYAQGPVASGLPASKVKKALNKKLVVKIVGDYAWEYARNTGKTKIEIDEFQKENFGGKIGRLKKIEREVCKQANKVIVPSQYLKGVVQGWDVSQEKINIVYNSFNGKYKPELTESKDSIVSVGRLVPWKGFEVLIEAFADLQKEFNNLHLDIIGDGPQKNVLEDLVQKLNLKQNINISGRMNHNELLEKLSESILVLNSGYEGLSHLILEAMSVGSPVIASNVGGNPELITHDENGILVEYNNKEQIKGAIKKILDNDQLQQKFINNSKERLKDFTFEKMINNTVEVLKS